MAEAKAKQDPATSSTKGAKAPEEKDPAKQTPDGQKRRKGQPKKSKTADSSSSSKHSVIVTVGDVHSDILDNLRGATSRKDYVQTIISRHLEAANPVGSIQEDDGLPGNEREVNSPTFRV
jgi:hypothetical protein